jgi:hypothetical protein
MIVFENNGVMDMRAVRTFGVSAKETTNPIGFFGTGLKYAIAILMRHNIDVSIFAGGIRYKFEKKQMQMRGKDFEVITMNGEELPFTTELGKNWQLWQAYREILCNCLDEGGHVYMAKNGFDGSDQKTFVVVGGDEFSELYKSKNKIMLSADSNYLCETTSISSAAIYNIPSKSLFYKNVRVMDYEKPAMMTYNYIDELALTEDRTVMNQHLILLKLAGAVSQMSDKHLIKMILTAPGDSFESELNFSSLAYYEHGTPEFYEVLESLYKKNSDRLNRSAREIHMKRMKKNASKYYEQDEMTKVEELQLKRAIDVASKVWPEIKEYQIMVVKSLGEVTHGLADPNANCIVLSKHCFHLGTKYLTSTIIEEFIHLKTGYGDCTRPLQTFLFDSLCSMIENHVIGEPI